MHLVQQQPSPIPEVMQLCSICHNVRHPYLKCVWLHKQTLVQGLTDGCAWYCNWPHALRVDFCALRWQQVVTRPAVASGTEGRPDTCLCKFTLSTPVSCTRPKPLLGRAVPCEIVCITQVAQLLQTLPYPAAVLKPSVVVSRTSGI
jgi:hypothetical protein